MKSIRLLGTAVTLGIMGVAIALMLLVLFVDEQAQAGPLPQNRTTTPASLIAAPVTLSTTWTDLGNEVSLESFDHVGLWVSLTISDSVNARVRLLGKRAFAGTDEYVMPIVTVGTADVKVEDEYYEFNVDADQKMVITWDIDNVLPVGQFQVQVSAVNTTAGQIESAYNSKGY